MGPLGAVGSLYAHAGGAILQLRRRERIPQGGNYPPSPLYPPPNHPQAIATSTPAGVTC